MSGSSVISLDQLHSISNRPSYNKIKALWQRTNSKIEELKPDRPSCKPFGWEVNHLKIFDALKCKTKAFVSLWDAPCSDVITSFSL